MSEGTKEELERQRARWWATVSSGDLDGYLALFDEDAVWVTPELDEIVGREAIRDWLAPVFAQFDYELTITVADVRVAGSLGIERARFLSRMTPKPPSARPLPVTPSPSPDLPAARAVDDEVDDDVGEDEVPATSAPDADEPEPQVGDEPVSAAEPFSGDDLPADAPEGSDEPEDAVAPEATFPAEEGDEPEEPGVEAPLVSGGPDAADDEPHEGRYLMYWRWHDDAGWLVQRYADVTGVG